MLRNITCITKKVVSGKRNNYIDAEWRPTIITNFEYIVAEKLCNLSFETNQAISINDEWFEGQNLNKELKNLIDNRFVSLHDNVVELTSISTTIGIA